MYCLRCGARLQDGSVACPYCGARQHSGGSGYRTDAPRINNIFSALVRERTQGAVAEFTLWCVVCAILVLSLVATIMGHGNVTWILLMLFTIGLGVIMAFRLKPIALLYSIVCFYLIIPSVHFACFAKSSSFFWSSYLFSYSALNIILFICMVLLSLGLVVCGFVHFFSRVSMGNLLTVLVIVDTFLICVLEILMYAVGYLGDGTSSINESLRIYLNDRGYWIGTVTLWCVLIVVMLFYIFFFWGFIDSRKGKIIGGYAGSARTGERGLRGVSGIYTGRMIVLRGRTLTIGSGDQVAVKIDDPYVSRRHCAIRYNPSMRCYEIQDISQNGVFLSTGQRIQPGVYVPVQCGTVICIGSRAQQFVLL